eukprot:7340286-Prorocentrum_lima.AAC.1
MLDGIPWEWKGGLMGNIPKVKGIPSCEQHRGIALMPMMAKVFGRCVMKQMCKKKLCLRRQF